MTLSINDTPACLQVLNLRQVFKIYVEARVLNLRHVFDSYIDAQVLNLIQVYVHLYSIDTIFLLSFITKL